MNDQQQGSQVAKMFLAVSSAHRDMGVLEELSLLL